MGKKLTKYSDSELFSLVGKGGRNADAAFEELYDRLSPKLFRYCMRIMDRREAAEDIFQESFVRLYKTANERRELENVGGYLTRIARNLCLTAKSGKHHGLVLLEEFHIEPVEADYENADLLQIIRTAVETLPENYREALVLREYDGMSYPEIAEILEVPISTVKIRIFRAKNKIRKLLAPYIEDVCS